MQTADFVWCNKFKELLKDESLLIKDKRKHHGALDKCFSEQQFRKSDAATFVV